MLSLELGNLRKQNRIGTLCGFLCRGEISSVLSLERGDVRLVLSLGVCECFASCRNIRIGTFAKLFDLSG